MRIALLARRFDPAGGGTERDLIVTARYLSAAGHDITIYADEIRRASAEWKLRHAGVRFPVGRALALMAFAYRSPRMARREGAELVLSFARTPGADVVRSGGSAHRSYLQAARAWRGAPRAFAMRLGPYHRVQMLVEWQAFRSRRLRRAIAVSNMVRDDLIHQFQIDPGKVVTLYNGVDLERFKPPADGEDREGVFAHYRIPTRARTVVFVGNGFARKGLGPLIDAWPAIGGVPHLLVVGADRSIRSYGERAHQMGVIDRVVFAGPQASVAPFFHAADALALPSMFEPFGNVVMEAMASGVPALASSRCGVSELFPEQMRGFIVEDPGNASEIALRLGLLLDSREDLRALARSTAERYPWERYGAELNALIAGLG